MYQVVEQAGLWNELVVDEFESKAAAKKFIAENYTYEEELSLKVDWLPSFGGEDGRLA